MSKYHVTRFFIDGNDQIWKYPTDTLYSSNGVFHYAKYFFNNTKIYSTSEEGIDESYIKCVGDDSKIIHLSKINLTNIL